MSRKLPELYIATDVEADGPIPGPYSMLSLGMAVVGRAHPRPRDAHAWLAHSARGRDDLPQPMG